MIVCFQPEHSQSDHNRQELTARFAIQLSCRRSASRTPVCHRKYLRATIHSSVQSSQQNKCSFVVDGLVPQMSQSRVCNEAKGTLFCKLEPAKSFTRGMVISPCGKMPRRFGRTCTPKRRRSRTGHWTGTNLPVVHPCTSRVVLCRRMLNSKFSFRYTMVAYWLLL